MDAESCCFLEATFNSRLTRNEDENAVPLSPGNGVRGSLRGAVQGHWNPSPGPQRARPPAASPGGSCSSRLSQSIRGPPPISLVSLAIECCLGFPAVPREWQRLPVALLLSLRRGSPPPSHTPSLTMSSHPGHWLSSLLLQLGQAAPWAVERGPGPGRRVTAPAAVCAPRLSYGRLTPGDLTFLLRKPSQLLPEPAEQSPRPPAEP